MGTTEAFLTAALLTICFIGSAAVILYWWMKYTAHHNEAVMLDCARKGGSTAAVRAIQKQLQLEGQGANTSNGKELEVERTRSRTDDDRGRGQDARAQPNPAQSPSMSTEVQRQRYDEPKLKPEDSSDFHDDPGPSHMSISSGSAGSAAAKSMEPDAELTHQPRGDARRQPRRH
jgi:hypothetical protein